jgi:hypothetical protein
MQNKCFKLTKPNHTRNPLFKAGKMIKKMNKDMMHDASTMMTEQNRRCIQNNCKDMLGQITEFELKASRIVAEEIL